MRKSRTVGYQLFASREEARKELLRVIKAVVGHEPAYRSDQAASKLERRKGRHAALIYVFVRRHVHKIAQEDIGTEVGKARSTVQYALQVACRLYRTTPTFKRMLDAVVSGVDDGH